MMIVFSAACYVVLIVIVVIFDRWKDKDHEKIKALLNEILKELEEKNNEKKHL